MIINTEKIDSRVLVSRKYIAIYGTQENPFSQDYDLFDKSESKRIAISLKDAARLLIEESEIIEALAEKLDD